MIDYDDIGLNSRLQSKDSLLARREAKKFNAVTDFEGDVERGAVTIAKMGTITADLITGGTIDTSLLGAGTINVAINVGDGNVKIDGANKRIIINDGSNDRILIGYQSGGF